MAATMAEEAVANPALAPDVDLPAYPGLDLAQFVAGCFWSVELAFQCLESVVNTEVGYSQGHLSDPIYRDVCCDNTGHVEVVRLYLDPTVCPYSSLHAFFWSCHDPTTLNS